MSRDPSRFDGLYRWLLQLFPSEFRGDFGRQMTADFRDQQQDAEREGRLGPVRLMARTAVDMIQRAPREHFDIFWRDAVYAIRLLRRRPASTATVVLSLAIGIGLNTALFSVVNGVLWRNLPFADSDRLVRIGQVDLGDPARTGYVTGATFTAIRDETRSFSSVAAGGYTGETIVAPGEPEQIPAMRVTPRFFEALGARPLIGRTFNDEDDQRLEQAPATSSVVVISRSLWQRRFLGRPDIVGQKIRLQSVGVVEIIGVVGPEMASINTGFGSAPEWWFLRSVNRSMRQAAILDVVARLAPGQTLQNAQSELDVIARSLSSAFPDTNKNVGLRAAPLLDTVVKNSRLQLTLLFGAVFCVLVVTCVNVIHLFLANAAGRRLELATRTALGATRAHLVRQTLTESLLVSVIGGTCGLLLALWGVPVLVAMAPAGIPRLHEIHLDWATLAFAAAVSLGVALVCGVAAALPLATIKPWSALGSARGGGSMGGRRLRHVLTIAEIAIALVLVVGSMLMVRTMRSLAAIDLGFDPTGVVSANMARPAYAVDDAAGLARAHADEAAMIDEVRQLPGVIAAGVGGSPMGLTMGLDGLKIPGNDREIPSVGLMPISVGYFEALGARLTAGRFFSDEDRGGQTVAVLSESTAHRLWPSESAIGKTFILPAQIGLVRVVGIVADMSEFGLVTKGGGVFIPHVQSFYVTPPRMLIRTSGDPQQLIPALKTIVHRANPEYPFPGITPLQEEIDLALAPRRFLLRLMGLFSVLGLGLAVIGIYGVLAESVAGRIPEIGVRMALGAQRSDVMALVLTQGVRMIAAGLVIGLSGAYVLRQQMTTMVYGVETTDPLSYVVACAAIAAAAFLACAIPARRATKLDPIAALRAQ